MNRTTRTLAATATTAALVLGGAGNAFAQKTTVKDPSGDVIRYETEDDEWGWELDDADSRDSGIDLKSFSVNHTKTRVKISAKFRDLRDDATIVVFFRLNGKKNPSRFLVNLDDEEAAVVDSGDDIRCWVPITTKTGSNGTISASIKRACLGNPKKVKASLAAQRYTDDVDAWDDWDFLSTSDPTDLKWTKTLKRG